MRWEIAWLGAVGAVRQNGKTADDDGIGKSSPKYLHFEYCIYLNSQYGQGPFYVRRIIAANIPSCLAASRPAFALAFSESRALIKAVFRNVLL